MSLLRGVVILCAVSALLPIQVPADVVAIVLATAGPWQYVNGGLNTAYQNGVDDHTAPQTVSAADGLDFSAGNILTITYASGRRNPYWISCPSPYCHDAEGDGGAVNGNVGDSGTVNPSFYIPSAE